MSYKFSNAYIVPWTHFSLMPGYWEFDSLIKGFGIYWLWFIIEFEEMP